MRSYLPDFPVYSPRTLRDALEAMASGEGFTPLAGGTDIMVYLESGALKPTPLLNLYSIEDVQREPVLDDEGLTLGPLSTYRHARAIPAIAGAYPMLTTAAREVSVLAIQSRATWVGNVVNASPAADGVPALMAHDAVVELSSVQGRRKVPLDAFYTEYKQMDRRPDELVTAVCLPHAAPGWIDHYRKVGTRRFQAISKTLLAGRLKLDDNGVVQDVRLVLASVAPHTLRAVHTEAVLRGKALSPDLIRLAAAAVQEEISPIDDIRSTQKYRRHVTANLLKDFLSQHAPRG